MGPQLSAQSPPSIGVFGTPVATQDQQSERSQAPAPPLAASSSAPSNATPSQDGSDGRQTKRILGIMPNFQAVSANTHLPPMSIQDKFWLATEGSFDYSAFISVGIQAAILQETNQYREFHQGAAAYGRYYWHTFADSAVENYLVGAIFPAVTHEDPRYYTLYRGGFFHRAGYAVTRLLITRNDRGAHRFNVSEIFGSVAAAEISSRYYPRQERSAGEVLERWSSQFLNDGVSNMIQEFWPDIHDKLVHRR